MSRGAPTAPRSYAKMIAGKLCLVTVTKHPDGPCIQRTQVMPDLFAPRAPLKKPRSSPLQPPKPSTI